MRKQGSQGQDDSVIIGVEQTLLLAPTFRDLSTTDVRELLPSLTERRFGRGESVWIEGDRADAVYIVTEGQLKSFRLSSNGAEIIVRLHAPVDLTGEVGLFHPSRLRQVSATAMEPTHCLVLRREPLLAFLAHHPAALQRMLEQLSSMATVAVESLSAVAFVDIGRRVAGALLGLTEEFGEDAGDDGIRVRLALSQSTLAAVVAASRENVNRALAALIRQGVVSQRSGHFHIHDLPALRIAADVDTLA